MAKTLQLTLAYGQNLPQYLARKYPHITRYRIRSQTLDARKAAAGKVPRYHYVLEYQERGEAFHYGFRKLCHV